MGCMRRPIGLLRNILRRGTTLAGLIRDNKWVLETYELQKQYGEAEPLRLGIKYIFVCLAHHLYMASYSSLGVFSAISFRAPSCSSTVRTIICRNDRKKPGDALAS